MSIDAAKLLILSILRYSNQPFSINLEKMYTAENQTNKPAFGLFIYLVRVLLSFAKPTAHDFSDQDTRGMESSRTSLALTTKPTSLHKCPVLGSKTALCFGWLKKK